LILSTLFAFAVATLVTLISTFLFIPLLKRRGRTGIDLHKNSDDPIAEMAGLGVITGLVAAIVASIITVQGSIVIPILIVMVLGSIGIYDDLFKTKGRLKFGLSFLLCSAVFYLSSPSPSDILLIFVPGALMSLAMGLAVSVSANAVNILAGFNGLESGTTAIAAGGILTMALISGQEQGAVLSAALIGSCLAFLYFNRYPSRAFPGDVGTLTMGGVLALSAILTKAEYLLPLLLLPHIFELFCKIRNRFAPKESTGHTRLGADGKLIPGDYPAFVHYMLWKFPSGERALVIRIWAIEAALVILSILIYLVLLTSISA